MHDLGLAPRFEPTTLPDSSFGKREALLLLTILLTFAAIWGYGLIGPRDAHFLLCYLIPPLLTFGAGRRLTILGVATTSITATTVEFLLMRSSEAAEAQGVTALFSVVLQSMVGYLALRQWRILAEEQHRRVRSDAELREVSSTLDALERSQRRLARRNRELATLNDVASYISRAASLQRAADYALDRVEELNRHSAALLLGHDAQAGGYTFLAQRGWAEPEERQMRAADWGRLLAELRVEGDKEQVVKARRDWMARGGRPTVYAVFPILDGGKRLGLLLVSGVFDEEDLSFLGALAGQLANAMVRDRLMREARAQAERQLAFERRLTRLLAEHAPAAMAQLSPDLKYVMANPAYLALMRAQAGDAQLEIIGRGWDEFAPLDAHSPRWHGEVAHHLKRGLPFTAQAQPSRSRKGHVTYWDWTIWPVKDEGGQTESVLLLGTEITDSIRARQQLEEALAEAWTERNKLEAVIENITDAVFITDARTREVVRVNSAAARLLGFADGQELEEELRDNPLLMERPGNAADVGAGEASPTAAAPETAKGPVNSSGEWLLAALGGEAQGSEHRVWRRRDGTPIHVVVGASPVRNSGGEVTLAVSTAHDVTRLLAIQEELERSNHTKDVFLAMLSHELRTPLTPVLGWVRILRRQPPDAELLAQGLEVIERNARLQAQLVDDLLDLSRVAMGKVELKRQPADLNEIVRRALETVQSSLEEKRLSVELDLAPRALAVNGDASRLEQVVWNLLANAIKFTPAGGRVRVRSMRDGEDCRLEVSDTGIGIAADVLPTVFAPFRQADSSITRRHGGLGIGLSIAQSIVALHEGRIAAESDGEGRGARFTVTLPAHTARRRRAPGTPAPRAARLDGLRVLVLEDSSDTRELLGFLLNSYGCEAMLAESVADGWKLIEERKPDLIISDIGMPDADGYEFVRQLRTSRDFARVPAIALTGYAMESDRQRAVESGFDLHLSKPIDPDALLGAIHQLRPNAAAHSGAGR
jgi:signal transduction histidine kinase/ActR/RegA family two-component response regulator